MRNPVSLKWLRRGLAMLILLGLLMLVAPVQGLADSQAGLIIPYSGMLSGDDGQPVPDGSYAFTFSLYDAPEAGNLLWSEAQAGVHVQAGAFAVLLGSLETLPEATRDGRLWLELRLRGPQDAAGTTLSPRQQLQASAVATSTDVSPSATSGTCAHNHLGEVWDASVAWSNGAFKVTNNLNGPTIWGVNTGGGNAIRGDGYGSSIGVYGEGATGPGVAGNSANGNGVEGVSNGNSGSGVHGQHNGNGPGVYGTSASGLGVYGQDGGANPDDSWAVWADGDMRTTGDMTVAQTLYVGGYATFAGGKSGYVVDFALNDDPQTLEPGDVVVISGYGPAVVGAIPVIKVRRAASAESAAVVGVVDRHYVPAPINVLSAGPGDAKAESVIDNGAIQPGEYLTLVTLGAYKMIKVDASFGAIHPGDLLVASPTPGYAMGAEAPRPGSILGKALGELLSGKGMVPVFITLQ